MKKDILVPTTAERWFPALLVCALLLTVFEFTEGSTKQYIDKGLRNVGAKEEVRDDWGGLEQKTVPLEERLASLEKRVTTLEPKDTTNFRWGVRIIKVWPDGTPMKPGE